MRALVCIGIIAFAISALSVHPARADRFDDLECKYFLPIPDDADKEKRLLMMPIAQLGLREFVRIRVRWGECFTRKTGIANPYREREALDYLDWEIRAQREWISAMNDADEPETEEEEVPASIPAEQQISSEFRSLNPSFRNEDEFESLMAALDGSKAMLGECRSRGYSFSDNEVEISRRINMLETASRSLFGYARKAKTTREGYSQNDLFEIMARGSSGGEIIKSCRNAVFISDFMSKPMNIRWR